METMTKPTRKAMREALKDQTIQSILRVPKSKLVYEKVMFKHFDGLNLRYSWTQLSEDEEKEYENLGNNVEVVRPSDQGNEFFQRYIVVMNLFTYF